MNHVPDDALAAIDALGEGLLVGEARPVDERLRSDLRVAIPLDEAALDRGRVAVAFRVRHATRHDRLADYGPFVGTVVEGVETRLREWGVTPPSAYDHVADEDGPDGTWRRYAGDARL